MKTIKELEAERKMARSIDSSAAKLTSKLLTAQLSIIKDVLGLIFELKCQCHSKDGLMALELIETGIEGS